MTDIVERLRAYDNSPLLWNAKCSLAHEAADEIERLRELKAPASRQLVNITKGLLDAANAEIERLQKKVQLFADTILMKDRELERLLRERRDASTLRYFGEIPM